MVCCKKVATFIYLFILAISSGFIDKYVGDAILALFETDADSALHTAIEIIHSLRQIQKNDLVIDMGIGIHYGGLMVGTIGEEERMDGAVIGETVNTAFRLESLNKIYSTHILISEQAIQNLQDKAQFKLRFIDRLYVKAKQIDSKIYEVFNADPSEIVEKKSSLMSNYELAMGLYQKQQFQEALVSFTQYKQQLPEDQVADFYIKRCSHWLKSPPQEPWQPIGLIHQEMEIT